MWNWLRAHWIATEGARLFDDQQHDKAIEIFSEAIRLCPGEVDFYVRRARVYEKLKRQEAVLADYASILSLNPARLDIALKRTGILQSLNQNQEAIHELTDLIHHSISLNEITYAKKALLERARLYINLKDAVKARADLDEYTHLSPQADEPAYLIWSLYWILKQDYEMAIMSASQITQDEAALLSAFSLKAIAYQELGQVDTALAELTRAIKEYPDYYQNYDLRCNLYQKQGNFEAALEDAHECVRLKPTTTNYNRRALIYLYLQKYSAALPDLDQVVQLLPASAAPYMNRAEAHFVMKNYSAALHDFTRAKELAPASFAVKAGLPITHHALGNIEEARRLWRELIAVEANYQNAAWVGEQHHWLPPLIEEAENLIKGMGDVLQS